ncbi:glutamate decarboxylase [Enterococcus faecium]|uniref:glutamate decarboxylase n=1 Tax=Enterococcus faecium TaxID=1352 RepID=UPI0009BE3840|nr:glutamate decarboxylase [Enterococcus faecium]EJC3746342.1 glutamate decarboxylase [Enterococcus faecium]OQO64218.1 glutamate decarboxylase [Enterococcus faecium]
MLFSKKHRQESQYLEPIFGNEAMDEAIPMYKLPKKSLIPRDAYELVKDQLIDEGVSRQNLATFCQTYMEPEAVKIMSETLDKNAIDKTEYPRTTEIENRCVNIIADLWNVPDESDFIGTSTVGSSEACMLGGLALKFAWRNRAKKFGLDINKQKPNLVISSAYQVVWEKFCVYWDIEMRTIPIDEEHGSINIENITDYFDEYTIGVVGILGITYTGKYDDIKALDKKVEEYNKLTKHKVYIHVDAASGGLFAPFVEPELKWDFRLKNVHSINTSGHKYGLVYPGVGWVIWKEKDFLPEELIFKVSYLGGEMPTMAINFSRSASQIIGQYYTFLRNGFEGYRLIHKKTSDVAKYLAKEIKKMGYFDIYNDGSQLPIVCYKLKNDISISWNLYDLTDEFAMKGWQVPTYPLPENLSNINIQRLVCRADLSMQMAINLIQDMKDGIEHLNQRSVRKESSDRSYGFTH